MKIIEHSYGADLSWIKDFANHFEGRIENNFIIVPESLQSGTRYVLECNKGIIAYYIDVTYNQDCHFIQKNTQNDFIGFYYNLTDGQAFLTKKNNTFNVNRWRFNLSVIDGTLTTDYYVKAGSRTYALCIFIKKKIISSYLKENNISIKNIDAIIDPEKNTIIRFDRMSKESYQILNDLHKLKVGGPIFNLNLTGTVHMLISNYLKKISNNQIIIQKVNENDLTRIIEMQMYLINHLRNHFPSIQFMANKANMSESKFKSLFKKITGDTPKSFFIENKLLIAKELLEKKQLSISQISDQLNFTNSSYFILKFKERFGLSPKRFIKQL